MPLFTASAKKAGVTYDRASFYKMCQQLPQYKELLSALGERKATHFLGAVFELKYFEYEMKAKEVTTEMVGTAPPQAKFTMADPAEKASPKPVAMLLSGEVGKIAFMKEQIAKLWGKAKGGALRAELAANTQDEKGFYAGNPHPNLITGRTAEVDKARHWVTRSMPPAHANAVLAAIYQYVFITPPGVLGTDSSVARGIFRKVVKNPPPWRPPVGMANYPSSFGGEHVLEWMFGEYGQASGPPKNDVKWMDLAMFYLGAIIKAQPFPDGNKRTAQTAYSVIMVNSGLPFIAPKQGVITGFMV